MSNSAELTSYRTVQQLADRLCLNQFTIYHWIKSEPERLPRATRIFGRVLFLEADIQQFIASPPERVSLRGKWPRPGKPTATPSEAPRKRGRPTKVEQARRRAAQEGGSASGAA